LPGVARVLESRTEGALKDETARRPWGAWGGVVLVSALLSASHSGCSAISATLECREAERAVAQGVATTPRGIYQLTLAHAYLEKAREEASEAHYGSASALAQAATLATHRAMKSVSGRNIAGHGAKGRGE
jgi:carbonic anhydrase